MANEANGLRTLLQDFGIALGGVKTEHAKYFEHIEMVAAGLETRIAAAYAERNTAQSELVEARAQYAEEGRALMAQIRQLTEQRDALVKGKP